MSQKFNIKETSKKILKNILAFVNFEKYFEE
jgi:hypothetical protein